MHSYISLHCVSYWRWFANFKIFLECLPPNSYIEALTSNVTIFLDRTVGRSLRLKKVRRGVALVWKVDFYPCFCTKRVKRPWENTARIGSDTYKPVRDTSPETKPCETLSGTFSIQHCEKINFCFLTTQSWGILLWHTEQTNIFVHKASIEGFFNTSQWSTDTVGS